MFTQKHNGHLYSRFPLETYQAMGVSYSCSFFIFRKNAVNDRAKLGSVDISWG